MSYISINNLHLEHVDLLPLPTLTQHRKVTAVSHEETLWTNSAPKLYMPSHQLGTYLSRLSVDYLDRLLSTGPAQRYRVVCLEIYVPALVCLSTTTISMTALLQMEYIL